MNSNVYSISSSRKKIIIIFALFLELVTILSFGLSIVISIVFQILAVFFLLPLFVNKLTLTKDVICCRLLFSKITCEWDVIDDAKITTEAFELISTHGTKNSIFYQHKRNGQNCVIPISLFVESWVRKEDWQNDSILLCIKQKVLLPRIQSFIANE